MDMEVVEWLRTNELMELKEIFARQKINTMRRVRNLTDELLKELVPEVGLRAELSEPLALLRRADNESSDRVTDADTIQSAPALSPLSFDDSIVVDEDGNQLTILKVDETPRLKRRRLNIPKHILSYQSLQSLESLDLLSALEEDIVASNAILVANRSGGLTDSDRNVIVSVAVKHLLRLNNKPGGQEYQCLAEKICKIFPYECIETYYIPAEPRHNATGKLPNKVKNLKYLLGRKGDQSLSSTLLLVPKTKTQSVCAPADLEGSSDPEDENVSSAILLLKHNSIDSWPEILKHWSITHPARRQYREQRECLKDTFKAPNGHLLVFQDFKELFPGRENCLLSLWENHRAPLLSLIRTEVSKNDTASLHLLNCIDKTEPDKQDALIFALLPVLCCKKSRGNSSTSTPAIAIIRSSFFIHVKVSGDLNRELANHQRSLQSRGLKFQPTLLAVGPTLEDINAWYVQVEDIRFQLRTAVSALDTCFKAFFTFDVQFSTDVQGVWLFIQRFFFNMHMPDDAHIPRVTSVISSLKGYAAKAKEKC